LNTPNHIIRTIRSSIEISAQPSIIWEDITNVQIEQFSDPFIFKILDIPKPLKAELVSGGRHGKRIAYFKNGKRFEQEILEWKPFETYSFSFNPEKGFRVLYWFDISTGVFQILSGSYLLINKGQNTMLELSSNYSLDKRFYFLFNLPVKMILKSFSGIC
jgi:hypothetical protein